MGFSHLQVWGGIGRVRPPPLPGPQWHVEVWYHGKGQPCTTLMYLGSRCGLGLVDRETCPDVVQLVDGRKMLGKNQCHVNSTMTLPTNTWKCSRIQPKLYGYT